MGILRCTKCTAIAEGKNFDEADEKIDHAIGLLRGNGCAGDPTKMTWDTSGRIKDGQYIEGKPKPVAENNVEMLVKSEKSETKKEDSKETKKSDETEKPGQK